MNTFQNLTIVIYNYSYTVGYDQLPGHYSAYRYYSYLIYYMLGTLGVSVNHI